MNESQVFSEKVKQLFSDFKKVSPDVVSISEISGGFTGAKKFRIDVKEGQKPQSFFLKVADASTHPVDAFLITYEAKIYSFLSELGLAGTIFPSYIRLLNKDGIKALVVDFLEEVSWGGPWNKKTIELLDASLKKLHSTVLSESDKKKITTISRSVRKKLGIRIKKAETKAEIDEKNRPFLEAWDENASGFLNAKGDVYFKGPNGFADKILKVATQEVSHNAQQLIMHDLNFANIGFSDTTAYFVDPIFVTLGSEYFDRTVVGVNILQQLGKNTPEEVKNLVMSKFLTSEIALARLTKYYVISSRKQLDPSQSKWQVFHQQCSEIALSVLLNQYRI
jgi:hypothetical protein